MSGLPDDRRLFEAMDRTWAPAEIRYSGPWLLRRGLGGGKRVSSASANGSFTDKDIDLAERELDAMNQPPLFLIQGENSALDDALERRGYRIVDPVLLFVGKSSVIGQEQTKPLEAIPCELPLAMQKEIWRKNGISDPRIDVMKRTEGPKTYLFARHEAKPAGAAFVACDKEIAMLHALVVDPSMRRAGIANKIMRKAANWASENGADYLSVVTTGENLPAQGLFEQLGMEIVGNYHYRAK